MTIAVADDDDDLVVSEDDLTKDAATEETSSTHGTSVSEMETHDHVDNNDMMEVEVDLEDVAAEADNEDFKMEVEDEEEPIRVVAESTQVVVDAVDDEDEDTGDVLDLEKLYELLEQSKSAGDLIAGKNVMLLIGGTGSGKTTTTLYLAGAKFDEVDVDGLDHYEPLNLPPGLSEFAVSGGATSVTKTIHATTIELPGGELITICDTPGFGDTKGTEMEISNGLGVIHALKRAASVKPVLVLNHKGMDDSRYAPLRKTLGTVIEMMGHCKDFSPFEYVFTRCERKNSMRVHRQLAGFQNKLRANAKDILGDNVEMEGVLDALLSDMMDKTKPAAISIDPTESEDASSVLESLWSNNKARMDHPSECFVEFIAQDASNKLDRQLNRMSSRMEKALKAMRFGQAVATLQELIRLAEVLPLPKMKNAVMKGKGKARDFVKHLQSEASQLVDRIVEQSDLDKVKEILPALREKLVLLSDTRGICDICQVPVDEHHAAFFLSMVARLFDTVESSVQAIDEPDQVVESKGLLQSSLLRIVCFSNALEGLGGNELAQACLTVKGDVFAKTQLVLSQVLEIEGDDRNIASTVLEELRTDLIFLVDMYAFFENHGITIAGLELGRKTLRVMLSRLAETGDNCLARLDEMTSSINDLDDAAENLSSTLDTLCSSDTQECRQYILSLLSSASLVNAVYSNEQQSEQSLALVIENFDLDMSSVIKKIADSAQNSADTIFQRKTAQSIQERIRAADELKRIITTTSNFCGDLKKWSLFDWQLDPTDKALYAVQKDLATFIEEKKKLNNGPEPLLYGPDVVGKQFHEMLVELRAFKSENTHCNVPAKYPKNISLANWVSKQRKENNKRKAGRNSSLTDQRLEALAALDFEWTPQDARWNNCFSELIKFRDDHGHMGVPRGKLYKWMAKQRQVRKAQKDGKTHISDGTNVSSLTKERIQKLNLIEGFWGCRK